MNPTITEGGFTVQDVSTSTATQNDYGGNGKALHISTMEKGSLKFREIAKEQGFGIFRRKVNWEAMKKICTNWIKNPLNMVLLLWIVCVAVSGAILFLVMTGMLDSILSKKSQREIWFEVNNQILNALFTLMCLYQHPKRFHHLVLLLRWKPKDVSMLRNIYCKNGTYKPHEWAHIMVVVVLLHVNCFAQYALCGLNLGYTRSQRPVVGVGICLSVAILAPTIAGVYSLMSPLGREYSFEVDEEAQDQKLRSFASGNEQKVIEYAPEWKGGLFDFRDDLATLCLSLFCCFCVSGWNLERLGFGNMYVHITTFFLFCSAPFWIFSLAATNIDNEIIREALVYTGIALCVFGLLYGGFWRIQIRKKFNLPANYLCCGAPAVTDCAQWLFCYGCSLSQEVRTADFYDMVEDKFCRNQVTDKQSQLPVMSTKMSKLGKGSSPSQIRRSEDYYNPDGQLPKEEDEIVDNFLKPPVLVAIQREDYTNQKA
ncbi:hypothetical protein UlMin_000863 [Ulmus minor]